MIDTAGRALTVTIVLTVVFVASVFEGGPVRPANVATDVALLALNTLPLLALHRNPVAVVLTFAVTYPLWLVAGHDASLFQSLPTLAALYAAGSWSRPLWLRSIALVAPVWMVTAVAIGWWQAAFFEIGYVALMFALVWALGVVVSARRAYTQELEDKTEALEWARQELAERAVADERARIARELHDVIAHAMSVITVRAGVGAHLADTRPSEAAEALAVIERTGREALSEMRRMLAVLRDPDPRAPRAEPQPGLAELPRLVEQVREAGVTARRAWFTGYLDHLITRDVPSIGGSRDPDRLRRYIEAVAVNSAGVLPERTIYTAVGINAKTAAAYEQLLKNVYVLDAVPAWSANRFTRLVRMPKRYLMDPSLVGATLRLDTSAVLRDGDVLGRLIDTFVAAQIRPEIALAGSQPRWFHLRDQNGRHEIDLVIEFGGGRVAGIEVKAGSAPKREDARHLEWLRDQLADRFVCGVVLHTGPRTFQMADRIIAAPISTIWAG